MNKIEKIKALLADGCDVSDLKSDGFEIAEDGAGDWEDDGKYQFKKTVVKDADGEFFAISESRSGSYWSDYDYSDPDVYSVKPVTKTITVYEKV